MPNVIKLPLNDTIAVAISKMVDDSQTETREPSHYDIECEFNRAGLSAADPKQAGKTVGKAKRVRAVLTWAIDNNLDAGEKLVYLLLSLEKSVGGFRKDSTNYIVNGNLKMHKKGGEKMYKSGIRDLPYQTGYCWPALSASCTPCAL